MALAATAVLAEHPIRFIGHDYVPTPGVLGHAYRAGPCLVCAKPDYPRPHGCRSTRARLHGVRDVSGRWLWERCDGCDVSQCRATGAAPMTLADDERARLRLLVDQSGQHLTLGDVHDRLQVAGRSEAEIRVALDRFLDLERNLADSLGIEPGVLQPARPNGTHHGSATSADEQHAVATGARIEARHRSAVTTRW
jgi:hypothetical protein